jgi:phosphatidate cytidylyltransferase
VTERPPAEGVRIIKAEEAQAALDAGEAAGRRPDDQLRYGDVPPAPAGPRPAHRFPLPDSVDPARAVSLPPLAPRRSAAPPPPAPDEAAHSWSRRSIVPPPPPPAEEAPPWAVASTEDPMDSTTEMGLPPLPEPERPDMAEIPEEGITLSGSNEMPHWSEPPTGEVPRLRFDESDAVESDDEMGAWRALGSGGVRWRDEDDWDDVGEVAELAGDDDPVGVLDQNRTEHSDLYSFDEDFERVTARTGSHPVVDLTEDLGEPVGAADGDDRAEFESPARRRTTRAAPPISASNIGPSAGTGATAAAATAPPPGERRRPRTSPPTSPAGRPQGGTDGSEIRSRVLIGVGLLALLVIAYKVGPAALVALAAVVIVASVAEAYNMTRAPGFRPATLLGLVATVGCVLGAYWKGIGAIPVVTVLLFVGAMLWYVLGVVDARPLANVAVTIMVFVWVSLLGSFSAVLLQMSQGKGLFLGAVLVAVAADTCAFGVGRWIGSRPMAASISPNKTLEGFIGGVVGALIVGAIIGKTVPPWHGMKHGLVLGLVVGLIAPAGDLFESMLKRDLGIKDSGSILGGHGGLLDRFDGILLALPAAYFIATAFHIH